MNNLLASWQFWASMSAVFAAATALLAKLGVDQVHPDIATFVRTIVVVLALAMFLFVTGRLPAITGVGSRALWALVLSGLATGASWVCYFRALKIGRASQVAPIDKLSVVLVALFAAAFLGERLTGVNWLGVLLIAGGAILVGLR